MKLKVSKETVAKLEKELTIAQRLNNNRLYRRVLAMSLIAKGKKAEEIAEIVNVSIILLWYFKSSPRFKG